MLLGISGKLRSGKDSTYLLLKDNEELLGLPVKRFAFADGVKEEVWEYIFKPLGLYSTFEESVDEKHRAANRRLWQLWGTEVRRRLTPETLNEVAGEVCTAVNQFIPSPLPVRGDYWTKGPLVWCRELLTPLVEQAKDSYWTEVLEYKLLAEDLANTFCTVTDVRFPNEAQMIKDLGGFVVRIVRELPTDGLASQHPSETSLDSYEWWDWVLENNGTLEDLEVDVVRMATALLEKELQSLDKFHQIMSRKYLPCLEV